MSSADNSRVDQAFLGNAMAAFLQISALVVLLLWCFNIVRPFIGVVVWALIIAVALHPLHASLTVKLGGKEKLSATIFTLTGLAIILLPTIMLGESTYEGLRAVGSGLKDGTLDVPPPNASVAEWPFIGEKVYEVWSAGATNLAAAVEQYAEPLKGLAQKVAGIASGMVIGVFQFVFSMLIAGVLLLQGQGGLKASKDIMTSLVGTKNGQRFTDLTILTIRSVVKGVLGVAVIQAILAAIGLVVMDVPAAGLWAGAIMVLAIVQLPPLIILGPIAIWVFSVAEPFPATIFLIYAFIVSISDTFLKPMLLGRGVETPMLVILIGAIGGAISSGIIGLFIGAVVLSLGYELLIAWMAPEEAAAESAGDETEEAAPA